MKYLASILFGLLLSKALATAELILAEEGQPRCVIVVDANATAPDKFAALDLGTNLHPITGATFKIEPGAKPGQTAIFVGAGKAARESFPDIDLAQLASEELVIKTSGKHLLLAGGGTRGTVYAVSRFLQDHCGVRWWTPWASRIPKKDRLAIDAIDVRIKPAFELREPFWYPAFDSTWAVRNGCNGQSARIPAEMGGCIRYKANQPRWRRKKESNLAWTSWPSQALPRSVPAEAKTGYTMVRLEPEIKHGSFERR